jgi:hypothetical protein
VVTRVIAGPCIEPVELNPIPKTFFQNIHFNIISNLYLDLLLSSSFFSSRYPATLFYIICLLSHECYRSYQSLAPLLHNSIKFLALCEEYKLPNSLFMSFPTPSHNVLSLKSKSDIIIALLVRCQITRLNPPRSGLCWEAARRLTLYHQAGETFLVECPQLLSATYCYLQHMDAVSFSRSFRIPL